jgi:hypothetical protein
MVGLVYLQAPDHAVFDHPRQITCSSQLSTHPMEHSTHGGNNNSAPHSDGYVVVVSEMEEGTTVDRQDWGNSVVYVVSTV